MKRNELAALVDSYYSNEGNAGTNAFWPFLHEMAIGNTIVMPHKVHQTGPRFVPVGALKGSTSSDPKPVVVTRGR